MIEEKEDFFEQTPEEKPKKEKKPKAPRLKPDDPRYYEREEGRWEHLTPSPYRRGPILWIAIIAVLAILLLVWGYKYFFTPVVDEAVEYGFVEKVQKEGTFFHSYEGVILPYKEMMDTLRPYDGDFEFSTNDVDVAVALKRNQGNGTPVRVEYQVYRHKFPWRGNTKVIVTKVDSVNPEIILPPDRHPEHLAIINSLIADSVAAPQ